MWFPREDESWRDRLLHCSCELFAAHVRNFKSDWVDDIRRLLQVIIATIWLCFIVLSSCVVFVLDIVMVSLTKLKIKTKARDSYIARLTGRPDQPRFFGWLGGVMVIGRWTCDSRSHVRIPAMTLPGYFWDRWPYFAGELSWDITTLQVNSALHPSGVAKSSTRFGWGKGGKVIFAGWQVTLCDLIWHVISRSGAVISITNCHIRFTLLLQSSKWQFARAVGAAALMRPSIACANEQFDPGQPAYFVCDSATKLPSKNGPGKFANSAMHCQMLLKFGRPRNG